MEKKLRNQSVTKFITKISESVFTILANINDCVRNECVCVCVVSTKFITTNACVGRQIENIHGVRTNILCCISNTDRSRIQNPQSTAFIGCNSIHSVQSVCTIANRIWAPIWVGYQLWRSAYRSRRINVSQRGGNTLFMKKQKRENTDRQTEKYQLTNIMFILNLFRAYFSSMDLKQCTSTQYRSIISNLRPRGLFTVFRECLWPNQFVWSFL